MGTKAKEIKAVFLGDSGVGKSSLLLRFIKNEFKEGLDSSVGTAFMSKTIEVNGNEIKFQVRIAFKQIWDTAGQEQYRSLAPLYYRDAKVAILVYDITSQKSFEELNKWVSELRREGPEDIQISVVANKSDRIEEMEVPLDKGKKVAQELYGVFQLTSAKNGSGVNELFVEIAKNLNNTASTIDRRSVLKLGNAPQKESKCPC